MTDGVLRYTRGMVTVKIGFPNGEKKCKWCAFCRSDPSMRARERCILTEEILYDIGAIGSSCPMTFTEDENDGKHDDL